MWIIGKELKIKGRFKVKNRKEIGNEIRSRSQNWIVNINRMEIEFLVVNEVICKFGVKVKIEVEVEVKF